MKHKNSIFLLIMLMSMITSRALAYDDIVGGIYYNFNTEAQTATVTNGDDKYTGDVVIPESVTYNGVDYGVTAIGASAFSRCNEMTSISIPEGVATIGNNAFYNCSSLTKVILNSNAIASATRTETTPLSTIFKNQVTQYILGGNVTEIGDYAFSGYSNLRAIKIPDTVKSLGAFAFYGCYHLIEIALPDTVTRIADAAFSHCRSLTEIKLPSTIKKINNGTFKDCRKLEQITIPDGVAEIGNGAFRGCRSLKSIRLPESVKKIGNNAFRGCTNLL